MPKFKRGKFTCVLHVYIKETQAHGRSETSVLVVPGVKDTKSGHLEYPDLVSFKKVCHTVKKQKRKRTENK